MTKCIGLIVLFSLTGCIYDVPLVEEAEIAVDPSLVARWEPLPGEDGTDGSEMLVILPFSETEYICVLEGDDDAMYFRAYPILLDDMTLIQLEWLLPDKNKGEISPYHICRVTLTDDILSVEYINEDVVSSDIKDSASLRDAVLANRENPDLFESPGRYRKTEE